MPAWADQGESAAGRPGRSARGLTAALAVAALSATALSVAGAAGPGTAQAAVSGRASIKSVRPTVQGWGTADDGSLGNGVSAVFFDKPVKVKLPKGTRVASVRAGCNHSLAVTATGRVLAWGENFVGQLGDGTRKNRHSPVRIKLPEGAKATGVVAGCLHTLATTSKGLYAWGDNLNGQLGNGANLSTDKPVKISFPRRVASRGKITSLFAGCRYTMALFSKGAVLAWGENVDGQLGDGDKTDASTPVAVRLPGGVKVRAISAGCDDGYALTTKGHVLAWGDNAAGELGDGDTTESDVPIAVDLPATTRVTALGGGPGAGHMFVRGGTDESGQSRQS
jgi:alpha-tubulin suppressor-like RCC1 family protein